jgi:uncharacterized protein (TIGR00661 family)
MAKIIYGVQGEGLGHATRSKVVLDILMKDHDIMIFSSSRAYDFLKQQYGDRVLPIEKTALVYHRTSMSIWHTLTRFLSNYPIYKNSTKMVEEVVRDFKPDLCITDFEMITARVARKHKIPLISVDNQHMFTKARMEYPPKHWWSHLIVQLTTWFFVPYADSYVIVSFYTLNPKEKNVFFVPSTIRDEILKAKPRDDNYFLVYQTSHDYGEVLPMLQALPDLRFIIYREGPQKVEGNTMFKQLHGPEFVHDLAHCKGIITNGGLSLIGEAIYLKKPLYCVPIRNQFEQIINTIQVEKMGFGIMANGFTPQEFQKYLINLPMYRDNLTKYKQEGNDILRATIKRVVSQVLSDAKKDVVDVKKDVKK